MRRAVELWALCIAASQINACRDASDSVGAIAPLPNIRAMVTADVARGLANDGTFATSNVIEDGHGVVSIARAKELAVDYMRVMGPYIRDHIEDLHGQRVDFADVTAGRVLVAESPYISDLPLATRPERKAYGSYYLVTVASNGTPFATLGVSIYSTDLRFTESSFIPDGPYGNEFRTWVIPSRSGRGQPRLSPEEAVAAAFAAVRTPVSEAPRFIRNGVDYVPQLGRWRIRFAEEVRVRNTKTGRTEAHDVLYLNQNGTFEVPAPTQVNMSRDPLLRRLGGSVRVARSDRAVNFVAVSPEAARGVR